MKNARTPFENTSAHEQRDSNPASDLFPETLPPVIPASWPTKGTRADEALQALIKGPQNQADYFNGWRLAAYVQNLEYLGWRFVCRMIQHHRARKPIAEYRLDRTDRAVSAALIGKGVSA